VSQRAANRAEFPLAAAIVDELQAVFGKVRVVYVCEGGRSVGTPFPVGVQVSLVGPSVDEIKNKIRGRG
jgi:hypothetical protein